MRHIINFFISGFLVWIFQQVGWIQQVHQQIAPFESVLANQVLVAGIIGLIFTVGIWLAGLAFGMFVVATVGIGCILYPLYLALLGPVGFWAVAKLLPGWVTVNANTWQIILMGILISWIRIHATSSSSSSSSKS